jgi:hypothetical protein
MQKTNGMSKPIEPTVVPTALDYAYIAGVVDGEGCIQISAFAGKVGRTGKRGSTYHELRLSIVNTNEPLIRYIQARFGGGFSKRKVNANRRTCAEWRIHGVRAAKCLRHLLPYLIVKRAEALIAIEMAETLTDKRSYNANSGVGAPQPPLEVIERREQIRTRLQELKRVEYDFDLKALETTS